MYVNAGMIEMDSVTGTGRATVTPKMYGEIGN
jgi:hypothetical protein